MALVVKNLSVSAGDIRDSGLIPGSGRSPGGGHGKPLQYPCLENPVDRESWWAIVHRIAKSQTRLGQLNTHAYLSIQYHFHSRHTCVFSHSAGIEFQAEGEKSGRWMTVRVARRYICT